MPPPDPYATLGVRRDARPETIRRAYHRKARKHHPDANPGDEAAAAKFRDVQAAYEVLSDPARRRLYDETGSTERPRTDEVKLILEVLVPRFQAVVHEAVTNGQTKRKDLVAALRGKIRADLDDTRRQIEGLQKALDGLQDAAKRFSVKEGENLLGSLVASQVDGVSAQKATAEAHKAKLQRAVDYLEGCAYRVDGTPGDPYAAILETMARVSFMQG